MFFLSHDTIDLVDLVKKILYLFSFIFRSAPVAEPVRKKERKNKQTKYYLATLVSESVCVVPPTLTNTETHLNPKKWDGEVELSSRCFSVHRQCENEKGGGWFIPTCQQ